MGLNAMEREILEELKEVTGNRKLKGKDLFAYYANEKFLRESLRGDEQVVHCPRTGWWCAIPKSK